jgi:putative hydrolase of the HAD superfamily
MAAHAGHAGRELQIVCGEFRLPGSLVPTLLSIFRAHRPALRLQSGVVHMLERLRRDGWRLAVLTNGAPDVQRRKVAALALDSLVDAVVFAEECAPGGKPEPRAFAAALEAVSLPPSRCVFIGDDRLRDIAGAKRAGMHAIQVIGAGAARAIAWDADAIITVVTEALPLVELLLTEAADAA